jgi:glycosyltransferase involved in cell wall biosynthesis
MVSQKNISVIAVVYNEAHRIESFLKSFLWCDDLIIVDKSSTDNTRDIVLEYTHNLIIVPYSDTGDELQYGVDQAKNEWIMTLTASDTIHPALVDKMLKLINTENFEYDVIAIPYALYVFGIRDSKRSPWHSTAKRLLLKKTALKLSKIVHKEYSTVSKNIYKMEFSADENLYHLTHENMSSFFERHNRYTRLEAEQFDDEKTALKECFKEVIHSLKFVVLKKKSYLLGWDGVALGLAYISYFIMKYLYVWEKFRCKGPSVYADIRKKMTDMGNQRIPSAE